MTQSEIDAIIKYLDDAGYSAVPFSTGAHGVGFVINRDGGEVELELPTHLAASVRIGAMALAA